MRHFIIVKFKDNVNIKELISPIKDLFNKTLEIEGIDSVEVHPCSINRPNRHDIMIEMNLTREALNKYDECEAHKTWKREYSDLIVNKTIFDCEK